MRDVVVKQLTSGRRVLDREPADRPRGARGPRSRVRRGQSSSVAPRLSR